MGGSAPKNTTTTVKNEPPAWIEPYARNLLGTGWSMAGQAYNPYPGLTLAPLAPQHQAGMYLGTQLGTQGGAEMNAGGNWMTNVLGGGTPWGTNAYAGSNPHLAEQIRLAQQEMTPDIGYAAKASGSFGNSGLNEAAARQYGDVAQNMRFQDYAMQAQLAESAINRNAQAQQAMAQLAPQYQQQRWDDITKLLGMGDVARTYQQQALDEATGRWEAAQQWPYSQMDWFTNLLRGAGYGSGAGTTTTTAPNPYQQSQLANLVGGGMALGGLYDVLKG